MAARITFGFSKAYAYSSPRRCNQSIRSDTVATPAGTSTASSGLPTRSRTQAKYRSFTPMSLAYAFASFKHLVGEREQLRRDFEAQRLRGRDVEDQLVLGRQLDRQVAGLGPFENAADIE